MYVTHTDHWQSLWNTSKIDIAKTLNWNWLPLRPTTRLASSLVVYSVSMEINDRGQHSWAVSMPICFVSIPIFCQHLRLLIIYCNFIYSIYQGLGVRSQHELKCYFIVVVSPLHMLHLVAVRWFSCRCRCFTQHCLCCFCSMSGRLLSVELSPCSMKY